MATTRGSCEDSRNATPSSRRSCTASSTRSAEAESSSAVGSSATTIAGRPITAQANESRCCSPPDSCTGRWSARPVSPSTPSSRSISASSGLIPRSLAASRTCSAARRYSTRLSTGFWNTYPTAVRRSARRLRTDRPAISWPPTRTEPVVGRSTQARIRSSDDLPDPDGPTIVLTRPGGNCLSMPLSASTRSSSMTYVLCTSWTAAAGSAVVATGPAQSGSPQSEPQPSAPNESLAVRVRSQGGAPPRRRRGRPTAGRRARPARRRPRRRPPSRPGRAPGR